MRVVFDCNVFLQAVLHRGPAFEALELVDANRIELFVSSATVAELRDVLTRPKLIRKYPQLTPSVTREFISLVAMKATFVDDVPRTVEFRRDPRDEPYLNLAAACSADFLVTRDQRHLLAFFEESTTESHEFRQRFPGVRIVDPVRFLAEAKAWRGSR